MFLVEPFDKAAERNPALAKLFSAGDAIGPFETGFWVGNAPWIAANRAALVDLCEDMIRFRRWTNDPKTAPAARALLSKLGKQPVEAYANVFTATDTGYRDPNLILDVANLQKNLRDLIDAGILTEAHNIAAKDYVDLSLAREAAARVAGR